MRKVVFDTNALLMPFQFSLNLDAEVRSLVGDFHGYVPGPVIGELRRNTDKNAKAALALARKYEIFETPIQGDNGIIAAAKELQATVVTNDEKLRARLRNEGIASISLRSRKRLHSEDDL
jgi:rRNA-processing protein FCF1